VARKQSAYRLAPDLGDQPAALGFMRRQHDGPPRTTFRRRPAHHRHDRSLLLGIKQRRRLGPRVIAQRGF
jgi:hypothetical protein